MSRTIVLELFLPFRLFKKTANIRCTTTSAQILNSHENKTKWRVALKRKTGAAAKHVLIGHLADWTIELSNYRTIEPKNLKSLKNMGVLPADARQQILDDPKIWGTHLNRRELVMLGNWNFFWPSLSEYLKTLLYENRITFLFTVTEVLL